MSSIIYLMAAVILIGALRLPIASSSISLYDFNKERTLPLRGVLAIGIIFHHMSQRFNFVITLGDTIVNPMAIFEYVGSPIVSGFFFMSGYGLCKSLGGRLHYLDNFLGHRFVKILPEFVLLSLIAFVYYSTKVSTAVVMEQMFKGWTPLPYSWFIYVIIIAYCLFYISARLSHGKIVTTGAAFCMSLLCLVVFFKAIGWGHVWYATLMTIVLGYLIAVTETSLSSFLSKKASLIAIAALSIAFGVTCVTFKWGPLLAEYLSAFLLYVCIRTVGMISNRAINFLGRISLLIYLVHGIFVFLAMKVDLNAWLLLILVVTASIATATILDKMRSQSHRIYLNIAKICK